MVSLEFYNYYIMIIIKINNITFFYENKLAFYFYLEDLTPSLLSSDSFLMFERTPLKYFMLTPFSLLESGLRKPRRVK